MTGQALGRISLLLLFGLPAAAPAQTLRGAGATFPYPMYQKWFAAFHQRRPQIDFEYQPVGSSEGIQQLLEKKVDFAASDRPLSDAEMERLPFGVMHLPTLAGAVVPIYNLGNIVEDLRFPPAALAGIYMGKITRWNDKRIWAANRRVALPDTAITVVHRAEGSGTTYVLTDYLSKVSPEWKAGVGAGSSVQWPLGQAAESNEGVAERVRRTPNSIGYVELIYALQNHLSYGTVQNSAGRFVQANLESVAAAASSALAVETRPAASDFRLSITDPPGREAYPIPSFTYLLVPLRGEDAARRAALIDFLDWMLSFGQRQAAALGYVPLPEPILRREREAVLGLR
jgi:phosphate transport system substrate-binding protein